jgi:hypothetical protein
MSDERSETSDTPWDIAREAGVRAFQNADYSKAERHFEQSMDAALGLLPRNWVPHVWSFDYLMLAYQARGKGEEMAALRRQALTMSEDLARRAEITRQSAATMHELEEAKSLKMGAAFYHRRANWCGKGAAEAFARIWPSLPLDYFRERVVWVGQGEVKQEAAIHVDSGPGWALFTLNASFCGGGEAQVSLRAEECEALIEALQQALAHAIGTDGSARSEL